jgi:hypothetical protein
MHQVSVGMGHFVLLVLHIFNKMAEGTIVWGDNHMDILIVMRKGIFMKFGTQGMALETSHHIFSPVLPYLVN